MQTLSLLSSHYSTRYRTRDRDRERCVERDTATPGESIPQPGFLLLRSSMLLTGQTQLEVGWKGRLLMPLQKSTSWGTKQGGDRQSKDASPLHPQTQLLQPLYGERGLLSHNLNRMRTRGAGKEQPKQREEQMSRPRGGIKLVTFVDQEGHSDRVSKRKGLQEINSKRLDHAQKPQSPQAVLQTEGYSSQMARPHPQRF